MSLPFEEGKIFSVTEISSAIKQMLEGVLSGVSVEGEISNLKKSASGHIYFDLKDANALISAVLFKGFARGVKLEEGLSAVVKGDLSCYIKQGRYQIIVKEISVKAKGDLYAEFERLKAKLSAEGLFDESRKLPLPKFPSRVGVITSPTGAAVRDILSVLKRRASGLEVIIAPVLVQGEGSKEQIKEALGNFNRFSPAVDVILLGRGGGSIEDLWSFNEEVVVRAVAESRIPVISCVGHETDFTLTDFAASLRAPTPSAAAELVVENGESTRQHISRLNKMLVQALDLKYEKLKARYLLAAENKVFKEPQTIFLKREQVLDGLYDKLALLMDKKLSKTAERFNLAARKLDLLSPGATLKRGYAIVRRASDGTLVQSSLKGERLKIQTSQDNFEVETI